MKPVKLNTWPLAPTAPRVTPAPRREAFSFVAATSALLALTCLCLPLLSWPSGSPAIQLISRFIDGYNAGFGAAFELAYP